MNDYIIISENHCKHDILIRPNHCYDQDEYVCPNCGKYINLTTKERKGGQDD